MTLPRCCAEFLYFLSSLIIGLGPKEMGDWHLIMEFESLAALDLAFGHVATRTGEVEMRHYSVNKMIGKITFALYRDFPDEQRVQGEELF